MAVIISTSQPIELVAGTGVQFANPPAPVPAITTDDLYVLDDPTETVTDYLNNVSIVSMIASGMIDGTTESEYALYTVPAGQTLVCTRVIFTLVDIEGSGDSPHISVAFTPPFQQIVSSGRVPALFDDINQVGMIVSVNDFTTTAGHSGTDFKYINAGSSLIALVDVAAGYATYRLDCFVFGFLLGNLPQGMLPTSPFGRGLYGQDSYGQY